jgi:hypothetical protein
MVWLWGLSVGLLLGVILGVAFARRQHRQRDQRGRGGSVTDWGQSLALVTELRREINRLRHTNARLQADRTKSLAALARAADSLEPWARRLPGEVDPAVHQGAR